MRSLLQNTRLIRRKKGDEARLLRLWISFVRSRENETFVPKYVYVRVFKLIPIIIIIIIIILLYYYYYYSYYYEASGDDVPWIYVFLALIMRPTRRVVPDMTPRLRCSPSSVRL